MYHHLLAIDTVRDAYYVKLRRGVNVGILAIPKSLAIRR